MGQEIEWLTQADDYVCKISQETQDIAKDELREDKNTRDQALDQVRHWIKMNPRIENCRLGKRNFIVGNKFFALLTFSDTCIKCWGFAWKYL